METTPMANTFIEPRPKGRKEGEPIEHYVVETASNGVLHIAKTQEAAIEWAHPTDILPMSQEFVT
jgi:hypothetical protein